MAIPKFLDDLNIIAKLGDNPGTDNGLSTSAFRAKFDEAALLIQKYINDVLIPAASASSSPEDGLNMKANINMDGNAIKNLGEAVDDDDAVSKAYVDALAGGKITAYERTLLATAWADNVQTVNVPGVTADATKTHVIYSPGTADATYAAASESNIRIVEQMNGAVKFKCEEAPTLNLTVNILVMK